MGLPLSPCEALVHREQAWIAKSRTRRSNWAAPTATARSIRNRESTPTPRLKRERERTIEPGRPLRRRTKRHRLRERRGKCKSVPRHTTIEADMLRWRSIVGIFPDGVRLVRQTHQTLLVVREFLLARLVEEYTRGVQPEEE